MTTRVACGQFVPVPGNIGANASIMRSMAAEAASRGAKIVVFPELALSGYLPADEVRRLAVHARGEEVGRMCGAAREAGISLCFGFAEKTDSGKLANSMAVIDFEGRLSALYRKVHLWEGEDLWAEAGDGFTVFEAGFARCGVWICYDGRFPEAARALALSGATLALAAAAWLGPAEEWELVLRARAIDNGMFVAGAALQGSYAGMAFHGASLVADPHGRVLARAAEGRDELLTADYDPEAVRSFRARLPLLSHVRPDAYRVRDGMPEEGRP
jgi:predicted amidohydrolase